MLLVGYDSFSSIIGTNTLRNSVVGPNDLVSIPEDLVIPFSCFTAVQESLKDLHKLLPLLEMRHMTGILRKIVSTSVLVQDLDSIRQPTLNWTHFPLGSFSTYGVSTESAASSCFPLVSRVGTVIFSIWSMMLHVLREPVIVNSEGPFLFNWVSHHILLI